MKIDIMFLVCARFGHNMKNFHYSLLFQEKLIRFIKIYFSPVQQLQLKILVFRVANGKSETSHF